MGREVFSRSSFSESRRDFGITRDTGVTARAEQQAKQTGKLLATVDPAQDVIRRSLMRFDERPGGGWIVTVGVPMPLESEVDTTGSMGGNVDISMKNLPDTYEMAAEVLPGYDLQMALGIFGDASDKFIFQRPQFEMTAKAIVNYLKDMVPERDGGDWSEDPHYGLFAAAYLTDAYINRIGLKGYHFCISDADAHEYFTMSNMRRVFGGDVLEHVNANVQKCYGANKHFTEARINSLQIGDVVEDLLTLSHAFFLQVKSNANAYDFWKEVYGRERVIQIPSTEFLPQVQAAIVGLTEGTLTLNDAADWLAQHKVDRYMADSLAGQLARIPLGAQAILRANLEHPLPKAGDIFQQKTDLWPSSYSQVTTTAESGGIDWL